MDKRNPSVMQKHGCYYRAPNFYPLVSTLHIWVEAAALGHSGTSGVESRGNQRLKVVSQLRCPVPYIGPNSYRSFSSLIRGLVQDYVHVKRRLQWWTHSFLFWCEAFYQWVWGYYFSVQCVLLYQGCLWLQLSRLPRRHLHVGSSICSERWGRRGVKQQ